MKKFLLILLTALFALCALGLTACESDEHTHTYAQVETKPTCTAKGYTTYICDCGDNYIAEYTDRIAHNYVEGRCKVCNKFQPTEGLEYTLSDDQTYYICSGIGTATSTDISIADAYNNLPVTDIGDMAFKDCVAITSITIPETITAVGEDAFYGCKSIKSVYISDLSAWCNINFSIKGDFCSNPLMYSIEFTSLRNYSEYGKLYLNNQLVTDLIIPEDVTCIKDMTFALCTSIQSVIISDSVTGIGWLAFAGCVSLTSIEIPNSVTSIGYYAFSACSSLTSIEIPNSVTSIGEDAFWNCSSLNYNIYDNAKYLGNEDNQYLWVMESVDKSITSCNISSSTKGIASKAFYNCRSLTSIEIPNSVTSIGSSAFSSCSSLTKVNYTGTIDEWAMIEFEDFDSNPLDYAKNLYINDVLVTEANITTATKISAYAFWNCSSLTSVETPDSVTSIGDSAFSGCISLTSIEIPDSVTSIGDSAFSGCISLTSIEIPDSVTSIGDYAFNGCSSLNYNIYDNAKYLGNSSNPYLVLVEATSKDITSCKIHNNTKFILSEAFYECSSLTSIEIPNSVISIGAFAFYKCSSLTSVTMGNSVTSIGSSAFYECTSLTSIGIPDSVTSIGHGAFEYCKSLQSVTIGNSVESIGKFTFYYCSSLTSVTFEDTSTWYLASSSDDYMKIDVTYAMQNAIYLKSDYVYCYWYKV